MSVVESLPVATSTVAVNAAFLQEIKADHAELWRQLEELRRWCAAPRPPGTVRDLADRLGQLRDRLAMHFALEEAYGYLDDALQQAPRLSERAAQLRGEHRELYLALWNLAERAEAQAYRELPHGSLGSLVREFHWFDTALKTHEARENQLIQDALDSDLGAGD